MKRRTKRKADGIDPKVLMDYDRWVAKHLDEMSRKYPHKVIAVYRGQLVAVGDSFKEVIFRVADRGVSWTVTAQEIRDFVARKATS
jgi:hypothetical protein